MVPNNKELSGKQRLTLLTTLKNRFAENMHLHHDLKWKNIQPKLERRPAKLWSLNEMEQTGGQPDVVSYDHEADKLIFLIVRQKVLKVAAVFVMIVRRWNQEQSTNLSRMRLIWPVRWALSC